MVVRLWVLGGRGKVDAGVAWFVVVLLWVVLREGMEVWVIGVGR